MPYTTSEKTTNFKKGITFYLLISFGLAWLG